MVRLACTLEEVPPEENVGWVRGAGRIDAVKGDVTLPKPVREIDNLAEERFLLLGVQFDIGAGEQRPARRKPKDDLARKILGGAGRFAIDKVLQTSQRNLEDLVRLDKSAGRAEIAEAAGVLIQCGTERVTVARKALHNLQARICKHGKADGVG
jgi:hypothetical protein